MQILELELAIPRLRVVVTGGTLRPLQHSLVDPLGGTIRAGADSGVVSQQRDLGLDVEVVS
jgi:DeoR family transcriptional regulator of aga operon